MLAIIHAPLLVISLARAARARWVLWSLAVVLALLFVGVVVTLAWWWMIIRGNED